VPSSGTPDLDHLPTGVPRRLDSQAQSAVALIGCRDSEGVADIDLRDIQAAVIPQGIEPAASAAAAASRYTLIVA
jgi:hypothetical protein